MPLAMCTHTRSSKLRRQKPLIEVRHVKRFHPAQFPHLPNTTPFHVLTPILLHLSIEICHKRLKLTSEFLRNRSESMPSHKFGYPFLH
jgi:hypothetical protein